MTLLPGEPPRTANLTRVAYTAELDRRPCRARDPEGENRALRDLAERLAASAEDALAGVAQHALDLCRAGSAGVSVVEDAGASPRVRWRAVAGRLAARRDATFPLAASPCGAALARERTQLVVDPGRRAPGPVETAPPLVELLVVPVRGEKEALRATLWVGTHDGERRFDREDARVLQSLASFVRAALASPGPRDTERRSAEDALRESEERFAQFMRNLPGLAWIKDLDGRYVFVNDAAERAFGRTRSELLGRDDAALFPPATARLFRANDRAALARRGGIECVETLEQQDGVHYSLVSKFPIPGADGMPRWLGGMAIDITERKLAEQALRENEARFRELADSAPILVWVNDLEGCRFVNRPYLRFLGCSLAEVRGTGWQRFLHPDDAGPYLETYAEAVRTRRFLDAQFRFRRADGQYRWLLSVGAPRFADDGALVGFAGISVDIDELRRSAEALKDADRRKDEFLATLAHELRNPLAPIRNALHVLRAGEQAPDPAALHELVARQVDHMVRLVDDLLEVSRITRGTIELRRERVELGQVLRAALEASRPLVDAGGHALVIALPDEPLALEADPFRLAQVFSNLLNNAAKYTEKGGSIELGVERRGDRVTVRVRDDGIGMPAELLPRIFDLFTQGDRTMARAQGGLGIGLTLVKRLTEMHGGEVEARSAGPGKGSELRVTLPLAAAFEGTAPARVAPVAGPRARPARRVVVVDDNRDAADSLAILLRHRGAEVRVAYDGPSAIDVARGFQPDAIVLDLGMPGMDGCELARRLRAEPPLADVLLIALTGWGQPETRSRSREAGIELHFVKPVAIDALEAALGLGREPRPGGG